MKNLIRLEELFFLVLAVFLNTYLPYSWWVYWAWFLAPDLSIAGYLVNTKVGAYCYNLAHHKAVAVVTYLVGIYLGNTAIQFTGLVLLGHSSFDRALDYGLKYTDDFKNTHLGRVGKP
jgi:hypothetical protein